VSAIERSAPVNIIQEMEKTLLDGQALSIQYSASAEKIFALRVDVLMGILSMIAALRVSLEELTEHMGRVDI
jgi:hypothetical protein